MRGTWAAGAAWRCGATMLMVALMGGGCSEERREPAAVVVAGGDAQTWTVGQELPELLEVRVEDARGIAVPGVRVVWSAVDGAGTVTPVADRTDAWGVARARWVLGGTEGTQLAKAEVAPGVETTFGAFAHPDRGAAVVVYVDSIAFTALDETRTLFATEVDRFGNVTRDAVVASWRSLDERVFTVDGNMNTAEVRARGNGWSQLVVSIPGASGSDSLRTFVPVVVRQEPASASISGDAASANIAADGAYLLNVGDSLGLSAFILDHEGHPLVNATPDWRSTDPAVATVSGAGLVAGVSAGDTRVIASGDSVADTVTVRVVAPVAPPVDWQHTGAYGLRVVDGWPLPYITNSLKSLSPAHHITAAGIVLSGDGTYRWWSEGEMGDSFDRRGTYEVVSGTTARLDRGPVLDFDGGVLSMPECGGGIDCVFVAEGVHVPSLTYTYYASPEGVPHEGSGRVWLVEDGRYFRQVYYNFNPWYIEDLGTYVLDGDRITLVPSTELRYAPAQPLTGTLDGDRLLLGEFVYLERP